MTSTNESAHGGGTARHPNVRRRWSDEVKRQIVAESYADGVSLAIVAQRHDISPRQLFNWRALMGAAGMGLAVSPAQSAPAITAIEITPEVRTPPPAGPTAVIVIDLPGGARVTVDAATTEPALRRVLLASKATS